MGNQHVSFISMVVILIVIFALFSMVLQLEIKGIMGQSLSNVSFILMNTTTISNCFSLKSTNNYSNILSSTFKNETNEEKDAVKLFRNNISSSLENCPSVKIVSLDSCHESSSEDSKVSCSSNDPNSEESSLDANNFDENGLLFADTKFNQHYSYELTDPLNSQKKIRITLDFSKHTQGSNDDINSPRLELVRENLDGLPDMSAAKNQEIIWQGNINEFFNEPKGKFENETYIVLQFNTGRHGSQEPEEERGFGVLFDVSVGNTPNLFEYRDDGKYVKYDFNMMKQMAGNDFVFHNLDDKGNPLFSNNLTNRENVELKVKTFLTSNNTRVVETFIDNGSGTDIPYWTLKDLSKLKAHAEIKDKKGFIETINQGSGYIIARTDNIDTRTSSFHSFVL